MNRLTHVIRNGFAGFVLGYLLTSISSQWIWLDMRFNIALIIPILTLAGVLSGYLLKLSPGFWMVTGLEGLWFAITLIIYRADLSALSIIPAVTFREGFGIESLSLSQVNILLLIVLIFANSALIFSKRFQTY